MGPASRKGPSASRRILRTLHLLLSLPPGLGVLHRQEISCGVQKYLIAVNPTIRAGDLDEAGSEPVIIEFSRDLTRSMDSFDLGDVPLNPVHTYQSALKDLQRTYGGFIVETDVPLKP